MVRGRPKKEVTRDTICRVRLTAEEYRLLTLASEHTKQPRSEIIRKALREYYKSAEITSSFMER